MPLHGAIWRRILGGGALANTKIVNLITVKSKRDLRLISTVHFHVFLLENQDRYDKWLFVS